jgi:small GTP-binding protein
MNQMKLCMVGSFAVGKSSLVKRYVQSMFSDKYHTTVGVKIDKKDVEVGANTVRMIIWDLAGEDAFSRLQTTFMRGCAGYLLVADGTRAHTLDIALELNRQIETALGRLPFILVLNKEDLAATWEIDAERIGALERSGIKVIRSSAKNGLGVESIFEHFATLATLERAS